MINVASIRAAASATPGDIVGISKAQLAELLGELEAGQRARRALQIQDATVAVVGIDRVSDAN
jgi:hypothetical protein